MGFEGSDAAFALWTRDAETGGWRLLADAAGGPLEVSLAEWRRLVRAATDAESSRTYVRVTASSPGSGELAFRYWGVFGGRFVEDEARLRLTALAPRLRADVDHDGRLGTSDDASRLSGHPFRFWYNEGNEKGDHIGQSDDLSLNAADLRVNGKLDLVNLFPVAVDVSPFRRAWGDAAEVRLCAGSRMLRYCVLGEGFSSDAAHGLASSPVRTADGIPLESAELTPLGWDGVDVRALVSAPQETVFLAFEAAGPVDSRNGPELVVSLDGSEVYRERLPVSICSVDEMYRYFSLRGAETGGAFSPVLPGEPGKLPDSETDGRHFVFVHGYNVSAAKSREWARAMFKRLWWAGSRSMFAAVDWRGDDSQLYVPTRGDVSPNYYINVRHAFMTAAALKAACAELPGRKVLLAHSLGNMLVSSAVVDHGLAYDRYYMLNAAVPMEAYGRCECSDLMVDGAWKDLDDRVRASRFYSLFDTEDGRGDFRRTLSWKGRFAGIRNAVNCYSPTEDVLANPTRRKVFGVQSEDFGGAWSMQELFKGCALWHGLNAATFAGAEIEGGWGINARYMANPLAYVPLVGFNAGYFADCTREDLIRSPLFTSFDDSRMSSTNVLDFVDEELRAKMLGDAIPAESFAAGANETDGVDGNYDMQSETPNGWPADRYEEMSAGMVMRWLHSDLKNVAFFYAHRLFLKIIGGLEK